MADQDAQPSDDVIEEIKTAEDTILSQLGMSEASPEQKRQIIEAIDKRVAVALTKVMLEKASPEDSEMIKLALQEDGNLEAKVAEIVQNNPSLQEEIRKALTDLWKKILKESEASRG
jgi:hypothetical protein